VKASPIFTVGHSTRTIEQFVALLQSARIRRVVDVRTIPRSRTNPHYNLDTLPDTLAAWQIGHGIIPELGGRRGRQREVEPHVNALWRNRSFHNYADYALSAEFRRGLETLLSESVEERCAIMCSEAVWWRCHRRIIADYLLLKGRAVFHLMEGGRQDPASLTPGARVEGDHLVYPATE
jgi:uncharacterized protein (DUF488 family)